MEYNDTGAMGHSMTLIAACVIWYNPRQVQGVLNNVLSYSDKVGKIYIIDNSESNNCELAAGIENSEYISLMRNTGIANALNVGLARALEDGYEWCMTMDQDSRWEKTEVDKYLSRLPQDDKSEIKNLFPSIRCPVKYSARGIMINKITHRKQEYEILRQQADRWICSGNVVNLKVWKKIGGFNAQLFIDEVDFDYCARYVKTPYKSLPCNDVVLDHQVGAGQKLKIFGLDNPRLFYQIRNRKYMMYRYPDYAEKYLYNKASLSKFIIKQILLSGSIKIVIERCKIAIDALKAAEKLQEY